MQTVATLLLVVLTVWSFIALVRSGIQRLQTSTVDRTDSERLLVFRDLYHFVIGLLFLILLLGKFITPVIALAVTSFLLIAFEYAFASSRRSRS
jgi:hypothetical protein